MSELDLGATPTAPVTAAAAPATTSTALVLAPPAPVVVIEKEQAAGAVCLDPAKVTELDPNRADLTGMKKVLKWLPGGDKIENYFAKYQSAQSQLNAIIKALDSGQDELRKDNAAIETEKANMWTIMGKLTEYNELA